MANSRKVTYLLIALLFFCAIWIQSHTMLNWDVSYLMHASEKLLAGGSYTQNFFETNPPMILFLYIPPVLLTKYLSINLVLSMRIYVFLLAALSLFFCWCLGKKIFSNPDQQSPLFILMVALTLTYLFLPIHELGQREHLTIMFIFPYLFACALRLSQQAISPVVAISVGLLAGLGFAIKPYFLIPLCLCELTLLVYQRRLLTWIRPESLAVLSVMIGYLLCVYLITPDYIKIITPLLFHLYYEGFSTPLSYMVIQDRFIFCLIAFVFFFITWKKYPYRELRLILFVAMLGFCICYLLEDTQWFYHLLPYLSLSIILTCLLCMVSFPITTQRSLNNVAHITYWTTIFWFPVLLIINCTTALLQEKNQGSRQELITFLQNRPQDKICYFMTTNGYHFPAVVDYAGKLSTSRYPNYWWLPGIIKLSQLPLSATERAKINKERNYFIQTIIEDIQTSKPDLFFVDTRKFNTELNGDNINYMAYFSDNKQLARLLNQYHFLIKTDEFEIYERTERS